MIWVDMRMVLAQIIRVNYSYVNSITSGILWFLHYRAFRFVLIRHIKIFSAAHTYRKKISLRLSRIFCDSKETDWFTFFSRNFIKNISVSMFAGKFLIITLTTVCLSLCDDSSKSSEESSEIFSRKREVRCIRKYSFFLNFYSEKSFFLNSENWLQIHI